mmetsp:Transcript_26159/g.53313  ORF Transcript_26159/g.53313 Transcript_26159/m.53313 type:complete len:164 (+) Transcript_26159:154-645(+)
MVSEEANINSEAPSSMFASSSESSTGSTTETTFAAAVALDLIFFVSGLVGSDFGISASEELLAPPFDLLLDLLFFFLGLDAGTFDGTSTVVVTGFAAKGVGFFVQIAIVAMPTITVPAATKIIGLISDISSGNQKYNDKNTKKSRILGHRGNDKPERHVDRDV